jgi:hypothetical protein
LREPIKAHALLLHELTMLAAAREQFSLHTPFPDRRLAA